MVVFLGRFGAASYSALASRQTLLKKEGLDIRKEADWATVMRRGLEGDKAINNAFEKYQADPSNVNEQQLQNKKHNLKLAYDCAIEKELEDMISRVENADIRAQHAESWKLINQISGRKATKKGLLKGHSSKERSTCCGSTCCCMCCALSWWSSAWSR